MGSTTTKTVITTTTHVSQLSIDGTFTENDEKCKRQARNALWLFSGAMIATLLYHLLAFIFFCTCIGIPIAFDLIKMSKIVQIAGNSKYIIRRPPMTCLRWFKCIIYFPFGLLMCAIHLAFGILNCALIIFIPFGIEHFKLLKYAICPFNLEIYEKGDIEMQIDED
eukprot:Awhi_evm1s9142